ncbi:MULTISPECIES: hypothetical protein [Streptomyces]|uniref:Uncharacterized protein n=1 Tax=Streptomyces lienomycini TaxID=284035 RepID=A0ABV9X4Q1_9ACTN|nr:hypothetical protein [Streptomyces lienomycini]
MSSTNLRQPRSKPSLTAAMASANRPTAKSTAATAGQSTHSGVKNTRVAAKARINRPRGRTGSGAQVAGSSDVSMTKMLPHGGCGGPRGTRTAAPASRACTGYQRTASSASAMPQP